MKGRKGWAISLCMAVLLAIGGVQAQEPAVEISFVIGQPQITINGNTMPVEATFTVHDTTLVPVRVITEAFGAQVEWLGETESVSIVLGDRTILLTIGSANAVVDGEEQLLLAAPVLQTSTTMVPLRFISETFGAQVSYDGAEYAAAYANPNGTVTLPQAPDSEVYDFVRWSKTADADGEEFTDQTPITGDMAVYAIGQEMFGGTEDGKTITTTYGMGATQDLSQYMDYAGETDAVGKFTYSVTNSTSVNGNTLNASITDDMLTIPADTNADTYTLTVTATEKTPVIVPFSVEYATEPATFEVTVLVNPAVPVLAEGGTVSAERVLRGQKLSTSEITGTVNGMDGQPLEGAWTWKNDRDMDETGSFEETVVFTPVDTNYAPFETTVSVTVYRRTSSGGGVTRYTVTFDTQGGSKISSKTVSRNTAVAEPAEPTREGYVFEGWFTDKDCTEAYDFSTKVTKNITLYAKWTEEQIEGPDNPTDPDEPTPPAEWENPFDDVEEPDWFYGAVKYVEETGLFRGVTETTFAPDASLTRAMLVTVLWRAEGQPVVNYLMTFTDVDAGAYYGEAVRWAASEGIVKGYSDEAFTPDNLITREQFAAIMQRYAEYKGIETSEIDDLSQFTDAGDVSGWALGNMQWAVGTGLITGRNDGSLDPQGSTTRAEAAAILQRFLEK